MKFIRNFIAGFLGVFLLIAIINALTNSSNSSHRYYDGRSHTGRNTWARENTNYTIPRHVPSTSNYSTYNSYTPPSRSYGSGNNHYAELWSECEDMEVLLEEYDIDHESLDYPKDYYELRDLRDEYQSLLDENEIDY